MVGKGFGGKRGRWGGTLSEEKGRVDRMKNSRSGSGSGTTFGM